MSKAQIRGFLIVAPWAVAAHGGVNGVIRNLVAHMHREGRVAPLLMQSSWAHQRPLWATLDAAPAVSLRLRAPLPSDGKGSDLRGLLVYLATLPAQAWTVLRILRQWRVGVVDIHYPGLAAATFALLRRAGLFRGTLMLSFHGSDARQGLALTGTRARVWRWVLRCADRVTCVSQHLADSITARYPWVADKLQVIHNGVEVAPFATAPRAKPPLQGALRIISVASFDRVKGVDVFLAAIARVAGDYPTLRCTLAGESGTEDAALHRLAHELGIEARLDWHVNVAHAAIPALLAQADLFVLASRNEGLGLALLEAGAAGLPVIATRVGGNPEVIEDGRNGVLVDSDDPAALAAAVEWVIEHRDAAVAMGQRLQRDVADRFSWGVACRSYIAAAAGRAGPKAGPAEDGARHS